VGLKLNKGRPAVSLPPVRGQTAARRCRGRRNDQSTPCRGGGASAWASRTARVGGSALLWVGDCSTRPAAAVDLPILKPPICRDRGKPGAVPNRVRHALTELGPLQDRLMRRKTSATRKHNASLERYCEMVGRDPTTIGAPVEVMLDAAGIGVTEAAVGGRNRRYQGVESSPAVRFSAPACTHHAEVVARGARAGTGLRGVRSSPQPYSRDTIRVSRTPPTTTPPVLRSLEVLVVRAALKRVSAVRHVTRGACRRRLT
jgi:hypothetical protein